MQDNERKRAEADKRYGYQSFPRAQFKHPISKKPYCPGYAWTYLWAKAAFKEYRDKTTDITIPVKRGQLFTSVRKLARAWGWGRDKVQRFLKELHFKGHIKKTSDTFGTLITISDFDFWHSQDKKVGHESDSKQDTPSP
jgi:hypothetical protein